MMNVNGGLKTPSSMFDEPSTQYERIKNEIKRQLNNKNNREAWPRGSQNVDLLFDFIKGKVPLRERVDINGDRCKSTKQLCARGCITGQPCVLQSRDCKIRSNEINIKNFITKLIEFSPNFQKILNHTTTDISDRKFFIQLKLLSLASECDLTLKPFSTDELNKIDKRILNNDYFKKNLKVNSHVVHSIALACIEPYVSNINQSIDYFIQNYHMLSSSPLLSPGWYSTFRGEQLTQAYIKLFGPENRQLACSSVCTLSNQPGTQSPIHGGRQSPGLTNAHYIWEKETNMTSPTSVSDLDATSDTGRTGVLFGGLGVNAFMKVTDTSPRSSSTAEEVGVAPERPLKKSKFEQEEEVSQLCPKTLKFESYPHYDVTATMNDGQGFQWLPFDTSTSHGYSDSVSNFGMCEYYDEPVEKELFDIFLDQNFDDDDDDDSPITITPSTEISSILDLIQL